MQSSVESKRLNLTQIKNRYAIALGKIEQKHGLSPVVHPNPQQAKFLDIYQLSVSTLFKEYYVFLQTEVSEAERERYLDFFRDIVSKGAPAEAMVCAAAAASSTKQDSILQLCKDWSGDEEVNVSHALQFAVIEYLTGRCELDRSRLLNAIVTLCALNASPLFESEKFKSIIATKQCKLRGIDSLKSALDLVLSVPEVTDSVRTLFISLVVQIKQRGDVVPITTEQFESFMPQITGQGSYCKTEAFQHMLEHFPELVEQYVKLHAKEIFQKLVSYQDYDSIVFLATKFQVDPFSTLIEQEEKEKPWPETHSFRYLEIHYRERLVEYIRQNPEKVLIRFQVLELVNDQKFSQVDSYRETYGIDPFQVLVDYKGDSPIPWSQMYTFCYLEGRDANRLQQYITQHSPQIIDRFLLEQLIQTDGFGVIDHCIQQYKLDVFPKLMALQMATDEKPWFDTKLFSYLERTFPERVMSELRRSYINLVKKFQINNDRLSLNRVCRYSFCGPIVFKLLLQPVFDNCRRTENGRLEQNFCELKEFKELEEINSQLIQGFFAQMSIAKSRELFGLHAMAMKHVAYSYNVDFYRYWCGFGPQDKFNLNNYYRRRAKIVFDFICASDFLQARNEFSLKQHHKNPKNFVKFKWQDKEYIVSQNLYAVLVSLKDIIEKPKEASELFGKMVWTTVSNIEKILKDNPVDEGEKAIYNSLSAYIKVENTEYLTIMGDNSKLSQFARREFGVYRDCVPILLFFRTAPNVSIKSKECKDQIVFDCKANHELCLLLPNDRKLEPNKLYLFEQNNCIAYAFITKGRKVEGITILSSPRLFTLENLNKMKPKILEGISKSLSVVRTFVRDPRDNESSLCGLRDSPLFDMNLLSMVFRFLGPYGRNDDRDAEVKREAEAKREADDEAKTESKEGGKYVGAGPGPANRFGAGN